MEVLFFNFIPLREYVGMFVIISIAVIIIKIAENIGSKSIIFSNLKLIIIGSRTKPAAAGVDTPLKNLKSLSSFSKDARLNFANLEAEQIE